MRLARAGNHVLGVSRSGTVPEAAPQLVARALDIREPEASALAVAALIQEYGRLDAVVNAAGVAVAGPLEDTPLEFVRAQLETTLFGAVYLFRAAAPYLRRFAPSSFVQISSIGAHVALPYQSLYCASHFALSGLCQSLQYEMAPTGVSVALIEPGSVRTGLTANRRTAPAGAAYTKAAQAALDINDADERGGINAGHVASAVEKTIMHGSAPGRQSVGHWHERITLPVQRFLPARLFRKIIGSHYRR